MLAAKTLTLVGVMNESPSELGLEYCLGVRSSTTVWPEGHSPSPREPRKKRDRPPSLLRRGPGHHPISVKELILQLPVRARRTVSWREGTNTTLTSRFAAVRVRGCAGKHK